MSLRGTSTADTGAPLIPVAKAMAEWSSDRPWEERHPNNRAYWIEIARAVMNATDEEAAPFIAKAKAARGVQREAIGQ